MTPPRQYAALLWDALASCPTERQEDVINAFCRTLADHGQLHLVEPIEEELKRIELEKGGTLPMDVTFAREGISASAIEQELKRMLEEKVLLTKHYDDTLIGGAIIESEDTRIDLSIRTVLKHLVTTLTH